MIKRFLLSEIKLEDPDMVKAQKTLLNFIKKLNPDRVLCVFRRTAGISDKGAEPYPGWENSKIGGHALGHYFSALAMAVSFAGDDELRDRLNYIVHALRECQLSYGSGFLSAASPVNKENPEISFDIEEEKVSGEPIKDSWVPWYAFHKVLAGVIDIYNYTGNSESLDVARGLGDWACGRALGWDTKTRTHILTTEYGGMNEALYKLYEITGDEKYKKGAEVFDDPALYRRLSLEPDALSGVHANTTIPKYLGALRHYLVNPEDEEYLTLTRAFFKKVTGTQTYITGGMGDMEHFRRDGMLDHSRTQCNAESCCVYNMMKLAQELFFITGETSYLDYYEKALKNARMGSWHPTGGTTYFNPMATGFFKVFGKPEPDDNMFWCCTGTGMEDFMKLADGIFYHDDDTLYVCSYSSAVLDYKEKNLICRLKCDPKHSEKGELLIKNTGDKAVELKLCLRIPDWVKGEFTAEGGSFEKQRGFMTAHITVESGEEKGFLLTYPMTLTANSLPDAPEVMGFSYGPTVLAAVLPQTDDMETAEAGIDVIAPKWKRIGAGGVMTDIEYARTNRSVMAEEYLTLLDAGIADIKREPDSFFQKSKKGFILREDRVSHEIRGQKDSLTFVPYDEIKDDRYGIYWYFKEKR